MQLSTKNRIVSFKFWLNIMNKVGRDSAVNITTRYGLDGQGIESRWGRDFLHLLTGPGAYPVSYTTGTRFFLGVKRPGRGVDQPPHLTPRSREQYNHTSTPLLVLHGLVWGTYLSC